MFIDISRHSSEVKALTSSEIVSIAQQITVSIDGANNGSGVIIERQGESYTVLTNWHVVQTKGSYTVQTVDGKKYNITQVKQLPGVDLALVQFKSGQNYQLAEKGDSDTVAGGKTVYVAGYPAAIPGIPGREFQSLTAQISGRVSKPQDGYALLYTVEAFPGMSGGPILNEEGKLVGIHGLAGTVIGPGGGTATFGIPLNTYLSFVPGSINRTPPYSPNNSNTNPPVPEEDLNQQCEKGNFPTTVLNPKENYLEGEAIVIKFANACPGKTRVVVKKAGSPTRGMDTGQKKSSELVKEYEGELTFHHPYAKKRAGTYEIQAFFTSNGRDFFISGRSRSFSVISRF
ncbi:MAG: hypothetical protein C6Y22_22410 [Hapalosiphonaceae cyanobacterium JJU2]|nr:MAG: hypothetical protein C6Y22_22410 [Hapalosiphonaceae cyanobacterium JJU2]